MISLYSFVWLLWFPNPSWGPELLCRLFSSALPWLSLLHLRAALMPGWSCYESSQAERELHEKDLKEALLWGFCPVTSKLHLRSGFCPWSLLKLHFRWVCACLLLCPGPPGLAGLTPLLDPRPALALWTCVGCVDFGWLWLLWLDWLWSCMGGVFLPCLAVTISCRTGEERGPWDPNRAWWLSVSSYLIPSLCLV